MAVDVTLNTIGSGFNRSIINNNFQLIETALQDALSRSGSSPNAMSSDLDLNGNDILNAKDLGLTGDLIYKGELIIPSDMASIPLATVSSAGLMSAEDKQHTTAYDTVALLLASTEASRGPGSIWEAGGFRYIEVASGGDITNSAGTPVQLDVLVNDNGAYNVAAFGATGDGVTDDTAAIQTAVDVAVANGGGSVFIPDGDHVIKDPGLVLDSNVTLYGNGFNSTLLTDGIALTGYWMVTAYGTNENTKISNVEVYGIHFKSTGVTKQGFNGFFIDDLTLRDNFVSGMGLGGTSDPTVSPTSIGLNSTNSYGSFTSIDKLNNNILITGNQGFCNNNADYTTGGVGAAIGYSANWVVSNNVFNNCRWGAWANGGQGNNAAITELRKCRRGTFVGNSVEFCHAGIWWSMCDNVVASGNVVSTCEDVGIDPEASNDCVISGNEVSHAKTACYSQFNLSTNVSFLSNSGVQDGVARGVASWSGVTLYTDSSATFSAPDNRENILESNTFIYKGATETGRVFINYSEKTVIQNNTFHNVVIETQPSSSTSFNCRFNTFHIENTTAAGITVIRTPDGTGNVGSGQDPMMVCDNFIKIKSAHADTIGIVFSGENFQSVNGFLQRNVIKGPSASIELTIGSLSAGAKYTYVTDNVVDGTIDTTYLYSGSYNASRVRLAWNGNKNFAGDDYFDGPPEKWYWNKGQKFYYNSTSSAGYIGGVVTTVGALYKELWSGGGTYLTGEFVSASDSNVYIAIADGGQAEDPVIDTDNTYWELFAQEVGVVKDFGLIT